MVEFYLHSSLIAGEYVKEFGLAEGYVLLALAEVNFGVCLQS